MTIFCLVCQKDQEADVPSMAVCSCGSRTFKWTDRTEKPHHYDRPEQSWKPRISVSE